MAGLTAASDGLPARRTGEYSRKKLTFLDYYLNAALSATTRKIDRVYVDLFAGPGRNVSAKGEFDGSPLLALRARGAGRSAPTFTEALFVNSSLTEHRALGRRVVALCEQGESHVPRERVTTICGDANEKIPAIIGRLHQQAYVFVFADIERASQLPWRSVESLKSAGHSSVDLYVLFPLEMGIRRTLPYASAQVVESAADLTAFFGTDEWKLIVTDRKTGSRSAEFHRKITQLYCTQLEQLWDKASLLVQVKLRGEQGLYRMLFATSSEAAIRIADAVAKKVEKKGQLDLL